VLKKHLQQNVGRPRGGRGMELTCSIYAFRFARCLACALALRLRSGRSTWWVEDIYVNVKGMGEIGVRKKKGKEKTGGGSSLYLVFVQEESAHCWELSLGNLSPDICLAFLLDLETKFCIRLTPGRSRNLGSTCLTGFKPL